MASGLGQQMGLAMELIMLPLVQRLMKGRKSSNSAITPDKIYPASQRDS
ncbi:hypothetical protein ACNKHX_20490 [Shigella flexneri]